MPENQNFASRLRELCDANPSIPRMNAGGGRLNYLREALAELGIQVENQSVSRWVNGVSVPRDDKLIPLARILGVTPQWLRFGAGDKDAPKSNSPNSTQHRFQLRPGLEITFDLPSDLTEKEADRLARMIQTLPLN